MSKVKFSNDLFLGKVELDRFKEFLDDEGFRKFLLENSIKFGLTKDQYFDDSNDVNNQFENGRVYEGSSLTLGHKEIRGIDSDGNFIFKKEKTTGIEVPADSNWYWVKIKHAFSSKEVGTFEIDDSGNLTGTDSELSEVLRGQPNFPTRVKFINSNINTLEYDVLEIIDDENAILQGDFTPESDLELAVVGTFTPNSVPTTDEKEIFQYDSCTLSVEQETVNNTKPAYIEGTEFLIARVKNDGANLVIQDKRTELWQPAANYYLKNLDKTNNPLIGVESIKYDHANSTKEKNITYIAWGFRSSNWTTNVNTNILTINGGFGGKFKTVADFTDDDFNGWRVYTKDGQYARIISSVIVGSQINLTLDSLDIDSYSSDGGTTFISQELHIVPDCDEVLISFEANNGNSNFDLPNQTFSFPSELSIGKCPVLVYDDTADYKVYYKYKRVGDYSEKKLLTDDSVAGYYDESSFETNGELKPLVQTNRKTYTNGEIEFIINPDAYSSFVDSVDKGDIKGINRTALSNSTPQITLKVGQDKWYQYYEGSSLSLGNDIYIILEDEDVDGNTTKEGAKFMLQFVQELVSNGNSVFIVQNFVSTSNYDLLREIGADGYEFNFIQDTDHGLYFKCEFDGTDWVINDTNAPTATDELLRTWNNVGLAGLTFKYRDDGGAIRTIATTPTGRIRYRSLGHVVHVDVDLEDIDTFTGNSGTGHSLITIEGLPSGMEPDNDSYGMIGHGRNVGGVGDGADNNIDLKSDICMCEISGTTMEFILPANTNWSSSGSFLKGCMTYQKTP